MRFLFPAACFRRHFWLRPALVPLSAALAETPATLTVTGMATVETTPDLATLSLGVTTKATPPRRDGRQHRRPCRRDRPAEGRRGRGPRHPDLQPVAEPELGEQFDEHRHRDQGLYRHQHADRAHPGAGPDRRGAGRRDCGRGQCAERPDLWPAKSHARRRTRRASRPSPMPSRRPHCWQRRPGSNWARSCRSRKSSPWPSRCPRRCSAPWRWTPPSRSRLAPLDVRRWSPSCSRSASTRETVPRDQQVAGQSTRLRPWPPPSPDPDRR